MVKGSGRLGYSAVGSFEVVLGSPLESTVIDCGPNGVYDGSSGSTPLSALTPRWDAAAREFWLGDWLIKRLRRSSENQELVLAVFEEPGWPRHIDDPLPPKPFHIHAERVEETCKRLNRCQIHSLLYFHASPSREIIMWKVREAEGSERSGSKRPR